MLRDCKSLRRCSCSHAISARAGSAVAAPQKPNVGTGYRPESLVRTDRHTQKLHNFFMPSSSQVPSRSSTPAIAIPRGAGHREDSSAEANPADSSAMQQEVLPAAGSSGQDGHRVSKRPRLLEKTTGTLAAAAAREKLQLEAHSGTQLPRLLMGVLLQPCISSHTASKEHVVPHTQPCRWLISLITQLEALSSSMQGSDRGCSTLSWSDRLMGRACWSRRVWTSYLSTPQHWLMICSTSW